MKTPKEYLFLVETGRPGRRTLSIYGEAGVDEKDALRTLEERYDEPGRFDRRILAWAPAVWAQPGKGGASLQTIDHQQIPIKWEVSHEIGRAWLRREHLAE